MPSSVRVAWKALLASKRKSLTLHDARIACRLLVSEYDRAVEIPRIEVLRATVGGGKVNLELTWRPDLEEVEAGDRAAPGFAEHVGVSGFQCKAIVERDNSAALPFAARDCGFGCDALERVVLAANRRHGPLPASSERS